MIAANKQRHSAGFVDYVREIAEKLVLIGVVMNRATAARRIFNADAIVQIIFRDVIAELPDHPAALEALHDGIETADADRRFVTREDRPVFRVNVDHAGVAKSELRRQSPGDERNVIGETRLQFLSETGNAFRQENVVDTVLQVGVFAADMKLAERILRDTGKAKNRLVERGVLALCLRIEPVGADGVTRRAETRHNCLTRNVEFLTLDDDFLNRRSAGRCRSGWCGARPSCNIGLRDRNAHPEKQRGGCG